MKKAIINILIVIIVIAIVILGYYIFSKYYFNFQNEKNIDEYLKSNFEITDDNLNSENVKNNIQNDISKTIPMYKGYKVLGMIGIDKINLSYPIIEANSDKDKALNVSIIKFFGNELNQNGNITLAGHNYYDSTMFAKLHMLEIGDKIKIIDSTKSLVEYEVYDIYSTSPNDITCLETSNYEAKELTLITCTKGNSQRLVIKAKGIN